MGFKVEGKFLCGLESKFYTCERQKQADNSPLLSYLYGKRNNKLI